MNAIHSLVRCAPTARPLATKFVERITWTDNVSAAAAWRAKHDQLPIEIQLRFDAEKSASYERPDLAVHWP